VSRNHNFNARADDIHDIWHSHKPWIAEEAAPVVPELHTHQLWGDNLPTLADHLRLHTPEPDSEEETEGD
jgi:hypothetical protein